MPAHDDAAGITAYTETLMRRQAPAPVRHFLPPALFTLVALAACTESPAGPRPSNVARTVSVMDGGADASAVCSPLTITPLIAANGALIVGEVVAANDEATLFVTLTTTGGWTLDKSHVFAGATSADVPTNGGGNAIPGRFP